MQWDPDFVDRSPMLAPLASAAAPLRASPQWPRRDALQGLVDRHALRNARGLPMRLVAPSAGASYERRIYEAGALEVREPDWHDLFNVLAWLTYPRAKAAINARHADAMKDESERGNRGRVRDALTLFDENGAIIASADPELLDDLRGFRWKALFWEKRARVREAMRVFVFGHALFEKALAPYVGLTAHAATFDIERDLLRAPLEAQIAHLDARAAEWIADSLDTPLALDPLPLLGVPGWWPQNDAETFYDDAAYFRPGRRRRSG